jgi:deoxyribose-phosphate aldolase
MTDLFDTYDEYFRRLSLWNPSNIKINNEYNVDTLKNIFNCIDLTSLNTDDSKNKIKIFCNKVKDFQIYFPDMPNVAAVCVYPVFTDVINKALGDCKVQKAVVSAGFPSSQTFWEAKIAETKQSLFFGANEVDIVIPVGEFLEKNYDFTFLEISTIKKCTIDAKLKVILETGILNSTENIWKASLIAMDAGADFIKTSTGKLNISATPDAAWVMTHAIKAYYDKTGKKIGFKPAGGIVTVDDAMIYRSIVKEVLGDSWLNNNLFRIGASRLANNVLTEIEKIKGSDKVINYF